jgi:hypothetical protein
MAKPSVPNILKGSRAYLSGPMDFVASRANEKKFGWRNRVGEFLQKLGVTVFDPWSKPQVRALHDYGQEGVNTSEIRQSWTFESDKVAAEARARISGKFWETMHTDLRMVDMSDFVIAYCPTNIYSVGTPHEIITCRQQRKPVLLVSPPVVFPSLQRLREHLADDAEGRRLLDELASDVPINENDRGIPSLWYMPLVGGERFFDGFGFEPYVRDFGWDKMPLDNHEIVHPPVNPLLSFLEKVDNGEMPRKWDNRRKKYTRDDDWLLWDFEARRPK